MQLFDGIKTFPARDNRDLIVGRVKFLTLGHSFELGQGLELVGVALEDAQIRVALPSLVDFLEIHVRHVEILELGQLEARQLSQLVRGDIEPLQVREHFLLGEGSHSLDLVIREVQIL